jgi:hypothetical protein
MNFINFLRTVRVRVSQSQNYFMTGGLPPISSSWRKASWDSRPAFFQLNTCDHSPYVTSSLMRGWVCRLQLLLALANTVVLRSKSRGTHDHNLLSQIRDSSNLEDRSPYLYPPGTGWPSYTPRHWVPFRIPASTRGLRTEFLLSYIQKFSSYLTGNTLRLRYKAPPVNVV